MPLGVEVRLLRIGSSSKKILLRIPGGGYVLFWGGGRKSKEEKDDAESKWTKTEVKSSQRHARVEE